MRVKLSSMPDPKKVYVQTLESLNGGLNLWDVSYRVAANQSPDMKNMKWRDGALSSRKGQEYLCDDITGVGFTLAQYLYQGKIIAHIGAALYAINLSDGTPSRLGHKVNDVFVPLVVPTIRGTFFRYGENLYYKTNGAYVKIDAALNAMDVVGYIPVIMINTDPSAAAGDTYQPENRIQPTKIVHYNAASGVMVYHLPVQNVDSVDAVIVDGVTLVEGTGYTVDLTLGTVTFTTSPPVTSPATNNTVKITYTKTNAEAYASIMECGYAINYGGEQNICAVFAGASAQVNAYFWSGNTSVGPDPTYFPIDFYNLAGDSDEPIMGFGKQQSYMIVLKKHTVGRALYGSTTVNSRNLITMEYTPVNDRIGCDLPWTIQLVENNLVFCNTDGGVYFLSNTSSAYENNVLRISRNINGTDARKGLLYDVQAVDSDLVSSVDDGSRYWIVANGHAYLWDYEINGSPVDESKLSWFYYDNINAIAFAQDSTSIYHLNHEGKVTRFVNAFSDYGGEAFDRVFRFAVQSFSTYYQLKDVTKVVFIVRSDTDSKMNITYLTDYEIRDDLTPVLAFSWTLVPRNLAYRILSVTRFAYTSIRKPGCRHIRHFTMEITNNNAYQDMSLISAQIFYTLQGVDR